MFSGWQLFGHNNFNLILNWYLVVNVIVFSSALQYSDDEDDIKRVVRSAKDKRYEALNEIIKNIRNSKKINDFNKMETLFMDLQKAFDKARPVVAKEENGVTPRLVLIVMQIIVSIFCSC